MRHAQFAGAVVAGLVIAVLAVTLSSQAGATPPPPSPPTFGQPTISGIQGVGFEQDLRLDPTNANRLYTSVPGSLSSDTSWIWRSTDAGKTFKWVTSRSPEDGEAECLRRRRRHRARGRYRRQPLLQRPDPRQLQHGALA